MPLILWETSNGKMSGIFLTFKVAGFNVEYR